MDRDLETVSREGEERRREQPIVNIDEVKPSVIRAKSARELVKRQEQLLSMVQSMHSDISQMDREASRIREDIVRSNQLFHEIARMKEAHNLQLVPEDYNSAYSMPKATCQRRKTHDTGLNLRYLNQLSTFRSNCLSESPRRYASSLSGTSEASYRHSLMVLNSSADDSYSETESDMESSMSRSSAYNGNTSNISQNSEKTYDIRSSRPTECSETPGRNIDGQNAPVHIDRIFHRRSSYRYPARPQTPPNIQPDEIEL